MKITASVKLDVAKMARMTKGARAVAESVLDIAARHVEAGWKERIVEQNAVDTGAYVNSVHVVSEHGALERTIADSVNYGQFVELGTSRMAARPCAAPAIEAERGPLGKALKAVIP